MIFLVDLLVLVDLGSMRRLLQCSLLGSLLAALRGEDGHHLKHLAIDYRSLIPLRLLTQIIWVMDFILLVDRLVF